MNANNLNFILSELFLKIKPFQNPQAAYPPPSICMFSLSFP